jgi:two-component system response regulator FlrC
VGTAVLVVDDDDLIRETLVSLLHEEGYTVYEAPDGEPALQRLRDHPDGLVVLLDVNMPGMDGITVLQTIEAESPLAARHAFILMTAQYRLLPLDLAVDQYQLGVSMLRKPFDVDVLLSAVATAAERLNGAAVSGHPPSRTTPQPGSAPGTGQAE